VKLDEHGTWWVTTEDAGLIKIRDGKVAKVYSQRDGLPSNRLGATCEDRKGNLWVGSAGPWLGPLKDGVFTAYPSSNTFASASPARSSLPSDIKPVEKLFEDREGNLWICTDGRLSFFPGGSRGGADSPTEHN
jgi:ligand-binding sensor domain-containing protein